jgi:hypothetical protein
VEHLSWGFSSSQPTYLSWYCFFMLGICHSRRHSFQGRSPSVSLKKYIFMDMSHSIVLYFFTISQQSESYLTRRRNFNHLLRLAVFDNKFTAYLCDIKGKFWAELKTHVQDTVYINNINIKRSPPQKKEKKKKFWEELVASYFPLKPLVYIGKISRNINSEWHS